MRTRIVGAVALFALTGAATAAGQQVVRFPDPGVSAEIALNPRYGIGRPVPEGSDINIQEEGLFVIAAIPPGPGLQQTAVLNAHRIDSEGNVASEPMLSVNSRGMYVNWEIFRGPARFRVYAQSGCFYIYRLSIFMRWTNSAGGTSQASLVNCGD